MLVLIVILLFCILFAVLPKSAAAGIVKTTFFWVALFALGTVLFFAWGFYLRESDKSQAVQAYKECLQRGGVLDTNTADNCSIPSAALLQSLPDCASSDPYQNFNDETQHRCKDVPPKVTPARRKSHAHDCADAATAKWCKANGCAEGKDWHDLPQWQEFYEQCSK
jgi:hypothetical protein